MGRILFIDDDTDALETYVKAVSLANHKADVASSVQDGWEMIQETEYDLIFVDLNIPEVSGFELIEKLSQDENTKCTFQYFYGLTIDHFSKIETQVSNCCTV